MGPVGVGARGEVEQEAEDQPRVGPLTLGAVVKGQARRAASRGLAGTDTGGRRLRLLGRQVMDDATNGAGATAIAGDRGSGRPSRRRFLFQASVDSADDVAGGVVAVFERFESRAEFIF